MRSMIERIWQSTASSDTAHVCESHLRFSPILIRPYVCRGYIEETARAEIARNLDSYTMITSYRVALLTKVEGVKWRE